MLEKQIQEETPKMGFHSYGNSKTFTQYLAAIVATLSAMSMGTHLAWPSTALSMLTAPDSPIHIDMQEASWIASLITLGGCAGAIPTGTIAMWLGPKRTLQIIALPLIAAWFIIAFSGCVWGLYVARFLAGLGTGAACVAAPMYVAELAEAKIRGSLGTFFQLQITIGLLVGYILGGIISDFKLLALISSPLPIVFLLAFSFMPESPVFLTSKGRLSEARHSLLYFRGAQCDVEDELSHIQENVKEARANGGGSLFDLFTNAATLKALVISLALMFFQQMSGINAVLFYALEIFKESGSDLAPIYCAITLGAVQVIATSLSTLLIDRLGRKILLIISASVMGLCLGLLGAYFHLRFDYDLTWCSFLPVLLLSLYLVVFSIGFGPIPWMMVSELFSAETKGPASSLSAAFNWSLAFTVTKLFLNVQNAIGASLTFGAFGIIMLIGATFCALIVPETKGKDLDEIQRLLSGNILRINFKV